MTTTEATRDQILALRTEARLAGDTVQVAICEVALGCYWPGNAATSAAARRVAKMTMEEAREVCARVIADAAAQCEEGGAL